MEFHVNCFTFPLSPLWERAGVRGKIDLVMRIPCTLI